MFFAGLGTATPARRYSQADCWEAVQAAPQFQNLTLRSRAILKKLLRGTNGIDSRHLALESLPEAFDLRPDVLHARFLAHAPTVSAAAAQQALADAGLGARDIDALLV